MPHIEQDVEVFCFALGFTILITEKLKLVVQCPVHTGNIHNIHYNIHKDS